MYRVVAALMLFVTPALAQQQQFTPSQIALQIDNAINQLAMQAEQVPILQKQIIDLQKQIEELKKERDK
jgi:hypothetical protein